MYRIFLQALIGGLTGALIMAMVLLSDGFNPLHNERFIYFGFSVGGLSSFLAAVIVRKKTYQPLTKQLHRYMDGVPSTHPNWHSALNILADLEHRQSQEIKTPFRPKMRS